MSLLRKIARLKSYKWLYALCFMGLYVLFVLVDPIGILCVKMSHYKVRQVIVIEKAINQKFQGVISVAQKKGDETAFESWHDDLNEVEQPYIPEKYLDTVLPMHCFHAGITTYAIHLDKMEDFILSVKHCAHCKPDEYTQEERNMWQELTSQKMLKDLVNNRTELVYEIQALEAWEEWFDNSVMDVIGFPIFYLLYGHEYYFD